MEDETTTVIYSCRKCRTGLFAEDQLSKEHEAGKHRFSKRKYFKNLAQTGGMVTNIDRKPVPLTCSSHFLAEPNDWMIHANVMNEVSGKLECPKCKIRVGNFDWSGSQCCCGTWLVPSFRFPMSKVDPRSINVDRVPLHVVVPQIESLYEVSNEQVDEVSEQVDEVIEITLARLHSQWLSLTDGGDIKGVLAMIDDEDCSMTTINKKCFDGISLMTKCLESAALKLQGRIRIVDGPVAFPPPSCTSRILFTVEGVDGILGESIYWKCDDNVLVQHVRRVKDPSDTFLTGS